MNNSIPAVVKNLLIINAIVFLAQYVLELRHFDLTAVGGLHFFMAKDFHLYQLVTYLFMHGTMEHIFWNMFSLWMFGVVMERVWGPKKFLFYYIVCGIGAGLMQEVVQYVHYATDPVFQLGLDTLIPVKTQDGTMTEMTVGEYLNTWTTIGASGAVYAILLAFGMTFPEQRIMLLIPPIPIKAKWLVIGYAAIELLLAWHSSGDGVAHIAHLGGMLFGFFLIRYWQKHPYASFDSGKPLGGLFEGMKRRFEQRQRQQFTTHRGTGGDTTRSSRAETDAEYLERKKREQEKTDQILDKIHKSGYDSLTAEEKKWLFDASRRS